MRMRHRFKRACVNFVRELAGNPPPQEVIRYINKEPEPNVVLDNQVMNGKNVLITGAGRNIGRSIALETAKQGANIFFTDIDQGLCLQLEQELNVYPGQSRGFVSDVSQPEDVETLCNLLKESDIKIDVLVNNVGIHPKSKSIKDMALEEWRQVFETNVFGPMYLTKVIAQQMVNHNIHGSIIFITSIHQWAVRCLPGYSASKAAVGMIIKELALDLAAHQIRVNGIAPGWVAEDGQGNPLYQALTPLHQTSIDPSYIGRAAVYLASDYFSKCTTGTVVKIDGGLSLHSHMTLMQE